MLGAGETMRLYDAHNHVQDERFHAVRDEVITAARQMGVVKMVVNGCTESDWDVVASLAGQYPDFIIPSFGLHPWFVHARTPQWRTKLSALLERFPRAGVGEIGLDRWKPGLPWAGQEAIFAEQFQLAVEQGRAVSIHCLQAWGALVELLEEWPKPAPGFLLHSYGGSVELVDRLASLGAYFSFPAAFAREKKVRQREAFQRVPLDRLLVETDAPDQLPPASLNRYPLQDQQHQPLQHPANLQAIYEYLAELREVSTEDLAVRVEQNFTALFTP